MTIDFKAMGKQMSPIEKLPAAKISVVGFPAVGKTTLTKLIRGQIISGKYFPTIGFSLGTTNVDGVTFKFWDFGGQRNFIKQHLEKYIHGSDIIFVVTDSTPENVVATKELLEYSQNLVDDCEIVGIANKQDLVGHMDSKRIEETLGIPTFPMVAIDPTNREKIIEVINLMMGYVEKKKTGK